MDLARIPHVPKTELTRRKSSNHNNFFRIPKTTEGQLMAYDSEPLVNLNAKVPAEVKDQIETDARRLKITPSEHVRNLLADALGAPIDTELVDAHSEA